MSVQLASAVQYLPAQSSIIGYFGFRFTNAIKLCSVLFGISVHAGFDKQDDMWQSETDTLSAIYCTVDRLLLIAFHQY